jgi:hypothetical protein
MRGRGFNWLDRPSKRSETKKIQTADQKTDWPSGLARKRYHAPSLGVIRGVSAETGLLETGRQPQPNS